MPRPDPVAHKLDSAVGRARLLRRALLLLVPATALLALALFLWRSRADLAYTDPPAPPPDAPASTTSLASLASLPEPAPQTDPLSQDELAVIAGIRARLHAPLTSPRVRLRLVEELVRFVKSRYPDTWRRELARLLRAGFPAEAAELLRLWDQDEAFASWLDSSRSELAALPPSERRALTWDARHAFFGDAADDIFAPARRNEAVADALAAIDAHPEGPLTDRFDTYLGAIGEQYGSEASGLVARRTQEVLDRFLSLASVQQDLAALDADGRYAMLHSLRESAGMDAAALERWSQLDRVRDARWAAGQEYVRQREAAVRSLSGEALARALDELRLRMFGEEAGTIADEEASGYFRFGGQRVYGQN